MARKKKNKIVGNTKIKVVGVGGAGCTIVTRLMKSGMRGINFLAINTDAQALAHTSAHKRLRIGRSLTHGFGTGMNPEIGEKAAEENKKEIAENLKGTDLLFIISGFGGGTGTGATPVVAEIAKKMGILTVSIVTKPFSFEGRQRKIIAEQGLKNLISYVDTNITISNDRALQLIDKNTPILNAFNVVDEIIRSSVQGIYDIINKPGLINVDFSDIKTILKDSGPALIGVSEEKGEGRSSRAIKNALENPLLNLPVKTAEKILFIVFGGEDLVVSEINDIAEQIKKISAENAKIIFGTVIDHSFNQRLKLTILATGLELDFEKKVQQSILETKIKLKKEHPEDNKIISKVKEKKIETKIPNIVIEDELEIPTFIRKKQKI
ncbi:cell division protein FtsZ [bacterium]|nr:cell division protein FtsZ [bacterium]